MRFKRFSTILKEKELWLLACLTILFFFRPLLGGETFYFRDLYLHTYPDKQFFITKLQSGSISLWNPFLLGGEPYLNNLSTSALYPLNLLFLVLPFIHAFNVFIIFHFVLGALGAYFFARVIALTPVSSLLVGVIYTLCGGMLSTANLPGLIFDMPYLPLIWACWHLFMLHQTRRWFVSSVVLGVCQALAWTHEVNEITMFSILGWTLCYDYPKISAIRKIFLWLLVTVLIIGCCAVVLVPAIEIVKHSGRQYQFNAEEFARFSLHPKRLLELVFPNFFGSLNAIRPRDTYWGWNIVGHYPPIMLNVYIGWITLALASVGAWLPAWGNEHFSYRVRRYCAILALCFLLGSLGNFLPFFSIVYKTIPFLDFLFHSPEKLIVGMILPLALLAGYASEWFGKEGIAQSVLFRRLNRIIWGLTCLVGLVLLSFQILPQAQFWWIANFFQRPADDLVAIQGLASSFLHAAIIMLLFSLFLMYRRLSPNRWQQLLLVIIVAVDLWVAGRAINFYAPRDFFTDIPDVVTVVKQEIGDGRLFAADVPPNSTLKAPSNEMMWLSRWSLETLSGYSGYLYDIPVIFHDDANDLGQKYIVLLHNQMKTLTWEQKLPIFSAGAVSLIITHEELSLPGLQKIAEIPNDSNLRFFLYRNMRAASRVEFITKTSILPDDSASARMMQSDFDPQTEVILSETPAMSLEKTSSQEALSNSADIQIEDHSLNYIRMNIFTSQSGYLVFSEPFYPGWKATVDGKPAPQLRANIAFTAIPIPAGEHIVTRRYVPRLFYYGAWISFGFLALTLALTHQRFGIVASIH